MQPTSAVFLVFSVLFSAAVAFAGYSVGAGLLSIGQEVRTVNVKGLAERIVKSDSAEARVYFQLSGNDKDALYGEIMSRQAPYIVQLKELGFTESEIIPGDFDISQASADEMKADPARLRYTLSTMLTMTTADVDKVKSLIDQRGAMIVDSMGFVYAVRGSYKFNALSTIRADMIAEATVDARKAALQFAADSNSHVGAIQSASQGVFSISDPDNNRDYAYDSGDSIDKKVRVVTTVTYFLKD